MLLKDLQTLATKLATGTLFHVEKAGKAYSVDYSALAKAIIEEYADSTVGGSKQSVQAAITALNNKTEDACNVRIATSANGSFASLCKADGTYAVYVNDANGKYCYGQFTIMVGKSYKWADVSKDTINLDASNNQGTMVFKGGTAPYTAKVVRQTYTPSNATVEGLNNITDGFMMSTADTYTKTLDLQSMYLVTVGKLNTQDDSYSGIYLVTTHRTASSIRTIAESSALSSITIDADTLSITTNTSYVIVSITRLTVVA